VAYRLPPRQRQSQLHNETLLWIAERVAAEHRCTNHLRRELLLESFGQLREATITDEDGNLIPRRKANVISI